MDKKKNKNLFDILLVEDNAADILLLEEALADIAVKINLHVVITVKRL